MNQLGRGRTRGAQDSGKRGPSAHRVLEPSRPRGRPSGGLCRGPVDGDLPRPRAQRPALALQVLNTYRAQLSGSMRSSASSCSPISWRNEANTSSQSRSWNHSLDRKQTSLWRQLASLESKAGLDAKALARVTAAIKKSPGDVAWRQSKACLELSAGRYQEAIATMEALRREKGADVKNNLLWAKLLAQKLDHDTEREAASMAAEEGASEAEFHTAAMVPAGLQQRAGCQRPGRQAHREAGRDDG